ncbi:sensor histidine kinase [Halovenus sp. HT40]|uniref:sensor histidine kinase n=1 Tax=Halovenus sp. HT40 TaxID=3126691 RepID=UPI00300E7E8B
MSRLGWASALQLAPGEFSLAYYLAAFVLVLLIIGAALGLWLIRTESGEQPVDSERLINAFDEPVAVLDPEDTVLLANVPFRTMFDSEIEGDSAADVLDDYPAIQEAVAEKTERDVEMEREGQRQTYRVLLYPIGRQPRPPRKWIVLLHDVTDHHDRQAELEAENKQLEEFASLISHDLRNPLDVAIGRTNAVKEQIDDPDLEAHLARTQDSHERMRQIITDVLTLARDSHGVGALESVPLETAVMDAWSHVETSEASLSVDTQVVIQADQQRLVRVFENLFRNAVEHGGDDVSIEIGSIEGGFFVADDGPGIDPDDCSVIFEPGYCSSEDGTGLGLAIVAGIAEGHGWTVSVTESTDGGAQFEFTSVETAPEDLTAQAAE